MPPRNSKTSRQVAEIRAEWCLEYMRAHPTLRPGQVQRAIREYYGCGGTISKLAYARALEMFSEGREDFVANGIDYIIASTKEDIEEARHNRDYRAADRMRMNLAKLLGIAAPEKLELSGSVDVEHDLSGMSEEELMVIAKAMRPKEK